MWSDTIYGKDKVYYGYIDRLYDVMKRLKGVHTTQVDAMTYLRDFGGIQHNFINDPKVMMYLDPSYLQQAKNNKREEKLGFMDKFIA